MGYTKEAIRGISWVGLFRVATRIITFVKTALLARILSPSQFGIYGISFLVLAFLETLTETGVNVILVQEKEDIEKHIDSAWIISIIRGTIISLVLILSAPFISYFFKTPSSQNLIYLISLVPFLRGFINPSVVKFQKELKFRVEFWYKFSVFAIDATIAIVASLIMRNPAGIILGLIAGVILEVTLSYVIAFPRPRLLFSKYYLSKIYNRGKWITLGGIFNYLFQNLDDVAVGKILGAAPLGFYQMAHSIATLPITEISDVFSRVTFPVYAKIAEDRVRLKKAFLKTILTIGAITLPFALLLFIFPYQITTVILGEKWISIVPLLKILAFFGFLRAVSGSTSALFLSVGREQYVTYVTFASILFMLLPLIPLVVTYGAVGAAMASFIGAFFSLPFIIYLTNKVLGKNV